ncbi:hypothetical protein JCM19000A_19630 [Silvimonas sp. JCM 19000]
MTERLVACPICGKQTAFAPSNPHRPFCSARCRAIDLGQWASEGYKVPATESTPDEGEYPHD